MMRFQLALLVMSLFSVPQSSSEGASQTVSLEKKQLPSTGQLTGITNIFFEKRENRQLRYPPDSKGVETAAVLQNPAFVPVYAIRYKTASGDVAYVVDTNGDLDFRDERALQFRQSDALKIADCDLTIRSVGSNGAAPWKMSYQIILSNDGYTYARISEYRQGEIRINGKAYGIRLMPRSRNNPLFSLSGDTICLIDLNRDGEFSQRWKISDSREIGPREEMDLTYPFIVGGERVKVASLDPAGKELKIQATSEEVSIAPGFKAPEFALKGIDNQRYSLANLKGKIVMLEFWSVSCPFCKHILPEVNSLIQKEAGEDFVALAVAREEDAEQIKTHLREQPRNATVVVNDKVTWQTYNGQGITPTYYLIDTRGVIRLSGYGASPEQLKVIERVVEQMRRGM